jgi:transcriptional regulator with XRE-family HTH domain
MGEAGELVRTIKKQLRRQGKTYREVAVALGLSEPSVKRLFASGRFTVERLVQVSNFLGYTLAELAREAQAAQPRISVLSEAQERELVSDPRLLVVTVCALNHWEPAEIMHYYRLGEAECVKYLLRLDRLRIIDLLPGNRIRVNVERDFDWLPAGPIQQYFRRRGLADFLKSQFAAPNEAMAFLHGMLTARAIEQMQEELQRLRKRFAELHEESLAAPLAERQGMALLFAMRHWEPEEFSRLRR